MAAKATSKTSSTPAQTMDQLLAKVGYEPKGLTRGQKVEGTVVEVLPNMLIVDIGAKSEGLVVDREYDAARAYIRSLKPGDKITATIVVPEREDGQPILSVRDTAEETGWTNLEKAGKAGDELEVRVEDANRGGLSVIYNGISGFVPSSHMGSKLSKDPSAVLGKTVKVKIIEIDKATNKLVLSERAVSESEILEAQQKAIAKVKDGEKYKGKVVALVSFGAFVQIEVDGTPVDGLVHVSELSWQKVSEPSQAVKEGDSVEVVVIGKPSKSESTGGGSRLAFSIKQAGEDPFTQAIKKYKPEQKVSGKVTRVADVGTFVEIEAGVEGLIQASAIPADSSVKVGDTVDCYIESIDTKSKRMALGLALKAAPMAYK